MNKFYHLLSIAILVFTASVLVNAQSFVEVSTGITGLANGNVEWGDFDNDKDMDILITGITQGGAMTTKVYKNDEGLFNEVSSNLVGTINGYSIWGDYDNDGDLDILITGENAEERTYLYQNNDGVFEDINANFAYFGPYSSGNFADFDNDGDLDVFLTGGWSSEIYRNLGDGNFEETTHEIMGLSSGRASWNDADRDGDLDLFLTGDSGGGMKMYQYVNDADGFTETELGNMGLSAGSIQLGDYDNDGDLDILVMGFNDYFEPQASIYRNNGDGSYTDIYAGLPPVTLGQAAWGDCDNDGDLDVAITGKIAGCGVFVSEIYENVGNDYFNSIFAGLTNAEYSHVSWGDFDNDSDLDLMLSGSNYSGSHFTKLYRNDMSLPNFLPEAPQNLQAEIAGDHVVLSWDKGTDIQTPQDALTYNVRVGTSPSMCNSLSPMAHDDDGYRKVSNFGNTSSANSYILKDLIPGETYYWSVQTLDNTFAASTFAGEQSFTFLATSVGNNQTEMDITFYPNPATDHVYVSSTTKSEIEVEIISVTGQSIFKSENIPSGSSINLSELSSGLYFIRLNQQLKKLYIR